VEGAAMARRWVNLVRVPLLLGIMVFVPQMVVTPLVLSQTSQSSQQAEAQRLYEEGEQLRQQRGTGFLWQALVKFQQALPLFRAAGDSPEERLRQRNGEADSLDRIGRIYDSLGQLQQPPDYLQQDLALDYLQQALQIYREVGNRRGEAITLSGIGDVYRGMSQPQQAINLYQQALPIFREVGDLFQEAITLMSIARVYRSLGQKEQEINFYQQALPIFREFDNSPEHRSRPPYSWEAQTLITIASLYSEMKQPEQSLSFCQQALPILRRVGDRLSEAGILGHIGEVYRSLGQPEQALNSYQKALLISREVDNFPEQRLLRSSWETMTLLTIGDLYSETGQPQQALNSYQQALLIFREVGNSPEERLRQRSSEALTLLLIGDVYSKIGQPEQALNFYQQALPIFREEGSSRGEARILYALASNQRTLNDLPTALQNIQAAIAIVEEIRDQISDPDARTSYSASVQKYYKLQADLLMELNQRQFRIS
jgi:tetratricopeptide (TPR) repeat protein